MLARLTDWVVERRGWIVAVGLATAMVAALVGRGLFSRLGYAVFNDPSSESTRAVELARAQFGESDPDVVALYRLPEGVAPANGVQDPAVLAALGQALDRLAHDPAVARVVSEANVGTGQFVSQDRRSTFAVISLRGDPRTKAAALQRLQPLLDVQLPGAPPSSLRPRIGGLVPSGRALTRLAEQSLQRGEQIALPLTGLLLVLIFGSLVAALLPLALGGLSIAFALGALSLLSRVITVDAFAVNVVTILGLGVAIDYALFIVTRYRQELQHQPQRQALRRAVETAGRSVLFSGVTVAASLSGLLLFRQPLLRSVAVGGMAVVLLAATLALVLLPATLDLLGNRLERGRIRRRRTAAGRTDFWRRLATAVIRRRVAVCVTATAALLLLGVPFGRLRPSRSDVRALPADAEPRQVSERLIADFPSTTLTPASLVVEMDGDVIDSERLGDLYDYTERLARVDGVARVEGIFYFAHIHDRDSAEALAPRLAQYARTQAVPTAVTRRPGLDSLLHGRYALLHVISTEPLDSPAGQHQIRALRQLAPPANSRVLVNGQAAVLLDFATSLAARAPWMLAGVAAAMFVVLFLAFRSVILPIKAMVMTALSLTASFGAIVFIFQDGRLQRLLGYQALGTIDASLPVVMFAVVFGLSMDYEVLILGRIREGYLRTGRNDASITEGLAQTGGLVTGAALIMVVVFSAFAVAPVLFVKALGMGMALAVALDATIVRMLLVPSTMALLGRLNWWAPHLRRRADHLLLPNAQDPT